MAERIGVFGGSFNPIHMGHLVIAEEARQEFQLSRVLFIPTGDTPGKKMRGGIMKQHRYDMVKLAIAGNDKFFVSDIEIKREGPSYTVDTIRELKTMYPEGTEFYFIAGTDSIADLPTWKYNKELLTSCDFICTSRAGSEERIKSSMKYFGELGEKKIHFLRTPELEISSTALRRLMREARSVRYLMPDAVIEYIHSHYLYTTI